MDMSVKDAGFVMSQNSMKLLKDITFEVFVVPGGSFVKKIFKEISLKHAWVLPVIMSFPKICKPCLLFLSTVYFSLETVVLILKQM